MHVLYCDNKNLPKRGSYKTTVEGEDIDNVTTKTRADFDDADCEFLWK